MKAKLRALVVDDERLARRRLIRLLAPHEEIEVVGEAENVNMAIKAIEKHSPDLLFLDIQMPGGDGFSLFDRFEVNLHVVFVTAFDQHALRAFEVNALDYLLKPIAPARLVKCIERLGRAPGHGTALPLNEGDRVHVTTARGARFISLCEVMAIRAAGDYTELYLRDGTAPMSRSTLSDWQKRLTSDDFLRVHRSAIVRVSAVERIEKSTNGVSVYLQFLSEPIAVSRRELANVQATLRAALKS